MNHTTLLAAALGLPATWRIVDASISVAHQRIDMWVVLTSNTALRCPECGNTVTGATEECETWYHDSFLNLKTYITVYIPLVTCACSCGVQRIAPPWERPGTLFRKIDPTTNPS